MRRLVWLLVLAGCGGTSTKPPESDGGSDSGTTATCDPNPCGEAGRTSCAIESGRAVCRCDPGSHDEGGQCVPDSICGATTCAGHGTCALSGGVPSCTCEAGYALPSCATCDTPGGYHPDGAGGCTRDACLPNPCMAMHTHCEAPGGVAACVCDPGFHDEAGACAPDEVCGAATCSGHGICRVSGGRTACACAAGYSGPACAMCAPGYHPDGAGGCTMDACTPNPCMAPNQTRCTATPATSSGYTCECDAGFHDDGVGNCTTDVCRPNPCAAMNQACRPSGTTYQCYTPACDDMNPCTGDTLVGGGCQHANLPDNSACSTTLCTSGQRCTAGVCGGGSAVTCDDNNPCTRNACDAVAGCRYTPDDTLVPADSVDCTIDSCVSGVQRHLATDARCDDGRWCSGDERCAPADPAAVAGCVHDNVPAPPDEPWSPCRSYGACDEGSRSFPLTQQPAGTACNDRIACTSGDRCTAAGACAGSVTGDCAGGACLSMTAWQSGIDFSMAMLAGDVTMNGGALPTTSVSSTSLDFYLIDRSTGSRQYIGGPRWSSSSPFPYALVAGSAAYSAKILPGVYDLLYQRGYASTTDQGIVYTYATDTRDTVPYGEHLLETGIVIGPGLTRRNLDFSMARLTGTVTMNSGPVPATSVSSTSLDFYLVDRSTGARQYIGGPRWSSSSPFPYALVAQSDHISAKVLPGTYDVLYRRGYASTASGGTVYVYGTDDRDSVAYGEHLVREGVVIAPGAQTFDLDFSMGEISGAITMNSGGPVPATSVSSTSLDFYLIDRTTGARQYIGGPRWSSSSPFPYALVSGSDQYLARVVPGTYDLLYRRGYASTTDHGTVYVYATDDRDGVAYGEHLLRTGIVITPGAQDLPIDFSMAEISGAITMNGGGALPATSVSSTSLDFYLVDRSTGARQYIGGPRWSSSSPFPYALTAGSDQYLARVLPGTYDLLYRRGYASTTDTGIVYVYATDTRDGVAYGEQLLRTGIVIAPGMQPLPIDFSMAELTGTITMNGGPVPATSVSSTSLDFYLVDRSTGSRQYIGGPRWSSSSPFPYALTAGSDHLLARVLPGTYDLLYRRGYASTTDSGIVYVYATDSRDSVAYGEQLLRTGIVIPPGAQGFPIDFSMATLAGPVTMNAGPVPPTSVSSTSLDFYVIDRSTGARQYIGGPRWSSSSPFPYRLTAGSDQYLAKILPGSYDLLYRRGHASTTPTGTVYVYGTDDRDSVAYAEQRIGMCLTVP